MIYPRLEAKADCIFHLMRRIPLICISISFGSLSGDCLKEAILGYGTGEKLLIVEAVCNIMLLGHDDMDKAN